MSKWPTKKLGDLTSLISSGATPLGGATTYLDEGPVLFLRSQNVQMRSLNLSGVAYIDDEADSAIKRTRVNFGDVLLNITGASIGRVSTFDLQDVRANVNQHVCVIRPIQQKLYSQYLTHFLASSKFQSEIDRVQSGGTRQALTFSKIAEFEIPLPPLPEQKRIATILDKADSIRRKRQEAVRLTEELLSSTFLDMFGDPETNPKGVKVVHLSDIAIKITDGVHQKPKYTTTGVPFISVKDITTGKLKFDNCKFISLEDHQIFTKRCKAEHLDILYTKVGATYGRPAIVNTNREFSLYVSVCLIKPQRKLVDSCYLNAVLGTKSIKRQADKRIKGIGVPDLHLDQIQQLLIPLPTMEEQREFARHVAVIEKLSSSHIDALTGLDNLFSSLLQRAFKGDL